MTVQSFESELSSLLDNLSSKQRRKLAREVAKTLRQSTQRRIAGQLNPDSSAFAKRKPQVRDKKGSIRRGMFSKLRTAKYLKTESSADAAVVGFAAEVERIARVHQYGLRDRVQPGGPEVQYPVRELLGFSAEDVDRLQDLVLQHLSN